MAIRVKVQSSRCSINGSESEGEDMVNLLVVGDSPPPWPPRVLSILPVQDPQLWGLRVGGRRQAQIRQSWETCKILFLKTGRVLRVSRLACFASHET